MQLSRSLRVFFVNHLEPQILTDDQVRAIITTAQDLNEDGDLRRLVLFAGGNRGTFFTGATYEITVANVQPDRMRIFVPVSRKGKGKLGDSYPVQVGSDVIKAPKPQLAERLQSRSSAPACTTSNAQNERRWSSTNPNRRRLKEIISNTARPQAVFFRPRLCRSLIPDDFRLGGWGRQRTVAAANWQRSERLWFAISTYGDASRNFIALRNISLHGLLLETARRRI